MKKRGKPLRSIIQISLLSLTLSGCLLTQPQKTVKQVPVSIAVKESAEFYVDSYQHNPDETVIQVGRYSSAKATATHYQKDLLSVVIQTIIPAHVDTVEGAMTFLLMRSGYELAEPKRQGDYVPQLLSKKLPYAHRKIGPITLKDALLLIVGNAYWMKVDPVHRLIAFEIVQEFQ